MTREDLILAGADLSSQLDTIGRAYPQEPQQPSKIETLQQKKQNKIDTLSNKVGIPVAGLYDADSIMLAKPYESTTRNNAGETVTTGRLAGVNSPELRVNGELTREGMNARIQADSYAMGVDAPNFPKGEGLEPQYYDLYKQHMDPAIAQRNKEGRFVAEPLGKQDTYGREIYNGRSEEMPQSMADYLVEKGQAERVDYGKYPSYASDRYKVDNDREALIQAEMDRLRGGKPRDTDSRIGETIDMAQALVAKVGADTLNMMTKVLGKDVADKVSGALDKIDGMLGGDGKAGWFIRNDGTVISDESKNVYDYRDLEKAQVAFGVRPDTIVAHNEAMEEGFNQWKEAKDVRGKLGAIVIIASQLDRILATSAGEILGLAVPVVGAPMLAATRTANYMEEYEKNNDKPMNTSKMVETYVGQLALLVGERFLIKTGLPQKLGGIAGSGPVKRGLAIAGSAAGEALQEYGEAVSEVWATQTEGEMTLADIAKSPESTFGAAVGGMMGGALRGGKEAVDVAGSTALSAIKNRREAAALDKTARPTSTEEVVSEEVAETAPPEQTGRTGSASEILKSMEERVLNKKEAGTVEDVDMLNNIEMAAERLVDDKVKAAVKRRVKRLQATIAQNLQNMSDEEVQGYTMGSKERAVDIIESTRELNSETRERVVDKLVSAGTITKEFADTIKKTFAEVKAETETGDRGYRTYEAILSELNKDPVANADAINKYRTKVARFLDSQEKYLGELESAVTLATKEAQAIDDDVNYVSTVLKIDKTGADGQPTVVSYEVPNLKQLDGSPVVVKLNRAGSDTGKFVLGTGLKKIVEAKRENVAKLAEVLDRDYGTTETAQMTQPQAQADRPVPDRNAINMSVRSVLQRAGSVETARNVFKAAVASRVDNGSYTPEMAEQYMAAVNDELSRLAQPEVITEVQEEAVKPKEEVVEETLDYEAEERAAIEAEAESTVETVEEVAVKEKVDTVAKSQGLIDNGAKPKADKVSVASTVLQTTKGGMINIDKLDEGTRKKVVSIAGMIKKELGELLASKGQYMEPWVKTDSPLRMILDNNGEVSQELAEVMALGLIGFRASSEGDLIANTEQDVKKWLGIPGKPSAEAMRVMRGVGKAESLLATPLGLGVLNMAGITTKEESAYGLKERLAADIGGTLLRVLEKRGVIENKQVINDEVIKALRDTESSKEFVLPEKLDKPISTFVVPRDRREQSRTEQTWFRTLQKEIDKQFGEDKVRKGARGTETNGKKRFEARNSEEVTDVSKYTQKVLNKAENTPFVRHQAAEQLSNAWGENRVYERMTTEQKALMELFGWVDTNEETTDVHVDKRHDVDMDNQTLFRKISDLVDHVQEFGEAPTYFDFFVAKSGRVFLDSATVNPQTDKIARFILTVKNKNSKISEETMDTFKIAVVQAFDGSSVVKWNVEQEAKEGLEFDDAQVAELGSIDKQSQKDNLEQFEEILKNEKVAKAVSAINDGEVEMEVLMEAIEGTDHPTHAMAALYEMAKYVQNDGKPGFESEMVIETDGVTSGVFLGHLLNPVTTDYDGLKEILTRGGMFFEGNEAKSYGEWKGNGGQDTYQVAIEPVKEGAKEVVQNRVAKIENDASAKNVDVKVKKGELGGAVLGLVDVTRNFMKSPLMVFFYGAGAAGIRRAIATSEVEKIIEVLSKREDKLKDKEKGMVDKVKAVLKERADLYGYQLEIESKSRVAEKGKNSSAGGKEKMYARKRAAVLETIAWLEGVGKESAVRRNDSMAKKTSKMKVIYDELFTEIKDVHGVATVQYLENTYSGARKVQKAMNTVFTGSFGVFKRYYDIEMAETLKAQDRVLAGKTVGKYRLKAEIEGKTVEEITEMIAKGEIAPSVKQRRQVIDKLLKSGKVPGILTVDADSDTNVAAITKRERVAGSEGQTVQIQLKGGSKVVNPLVYEYVANPVAGGVLNIHYFDSAMIQRIIVEGTGLGVHDAFVTHVNNAVKAGKTYNTAVWEASQKYNMMRKVQEHYEKLNNPADMVAFKEAVFDRDHMEFRVDPFAEEAGLSVEEYMEWSLLKLEDTLAVSVNNIDVNHKKLANESFRLQQMAGPEGIAFEYKGEGKEVVEPYREFKTDDELLTEVAPAQAKLQEKIAIIAEISSKVVSKVQDLTEAEKALLKLEVNEIRETLLEQMNCN